MNDAVVKSASDFLPRRRQWVEGNPRGRQGVWTIFYQPEWLVDPIMHRLANCAGWDLLIGVFEPIDDKDIICELTLTCTEGDLAQYVRLIVRPPEYPIWPPRLGVPGEDLDLDFDSWDEAWFVCCLLIQGLAPLRLRFATISI